MDLRSFEADAAGSPPTPPATPSVGYPTNGNPVGAVPATKPGDYWFHQIAEELRNVVVNSGLTPDDEVLDQLWQSLRGLSEHPLGALPYPTIATADNRLNVSAASASAGGTVSVPADTWLTLGQELVAGETGRMRAFKTAAWQSADLDASSTYYLRAQVSAGALLPYVQKGTDGDSIPAGLKGTPDGGSGGGFDSTVLDVLLAKVVTGSAASTPTVTKLANAAVLAAHFAVTVAGSTPVSSAWQVTGSSTFVTNWARTPRAYPVRGVARSGGGTPAMQAFANQTNISSFSRYSTQVGCTTDWDDAAPTGPYNVDLQYDPVS